MVGSCKYIIFLSLSIVQYCTVGFAVVNLNRVRQYACFVQVQLQIFQVLLKCVFARPFLWFLAKPLLWWKRTEQKWTMWKSLGGENFNGYNKIKIYTLLKKQTTNVFFGNLVLALKPLLKFGTWFHVGRCVLKKNFVNHLSLRLLVFRNTCWTWYLFPTWTYFVTDFCLRLPLFSLSMHVAWICKLLLI